MPNDGNRVTPRRTGAVAIRGADAVSRKLHRLFNNANIASWCSWVPAGAENTHGQLIDLAIFPSQVSEIWFQARRSAGRLGDELVRLELEPVPVMRSRRKPCSVPNSPSPIWRGISGCAACYRSAWAHLSMEFDLRWDPGASSDKLRRCARCTVCGHKGATLQHPSWVEGGIGWQPFSVDQMDKKRFPLRRRWETEAPFTKARDAFLAVYDQQSNRTLEPLIEHAPRTEDGYVDLRGFDFGMTGAFVGKAHLKPRYRELNVDRVDFSEALFENCNFQEASLTDCKFQAADFYDFFSKDTKFSRCYFSSPFMKTLVLEYVVSMINAILTMSEQRAQDSPSGFRTSTLIARCGMFGFL
jgi:Pentapeptide repeats (8 copies)